MTTTAGRLPPNVPEWLDLYHEARRLTALYTWLSPMEAGNAVDEAVRDDTIPVTGFFSMLRDDDESIVKTMPLRPDGEDEWYETAEANLYRRTERIRTADLQKLIDRINGEELSGRSSDAGRRRGPKGKPEEIIDLFWVETLAHIIEKGWPRSQAALEEYVTKKLDQLRPHEPVSGAWAQPRIKMLYDRLGRGQSRGQ